jgi:hypothetical protein
MSISEETNNQQPSTAKKGEGSETIPQGSRDKANPETGSTLTSYVEGEDIVHINKNNRFELFLKKANERHGDKFCYDKFFYINAKTRGTITCLEHGDFTQSPDKHLNTTLPCPECLSEYREKATINNNSQKASVTKITKSLDKFKNRLSNELGNKFKFVEESFRGMSKKVGMVCPEHGLFEITPHNLFKSKYGCPGCGSVGRAKAKTKSYDNFLSEVNDKFGDKYEYPNIDKLYHNRKSVIEVVCPEHGLFFKKAQKHLSGQGCFQCKIDELILAGKLVGGYNDNLFDNNPSIGDEYGVLYYLKINNGEYYKVGITRVSIEDRIKGVKTKAKQEGYVIDEVDIIYSLNTTLKDAYDKEQKIITENDSERAYTKWSTELFQSDIKPKTYFIN